MRSVMSLEPGRKGRRWLARRLQLPKRNPNAGSRKSIGKIANLRWIFTTVYCCNDAALYFDCIIVAELKKHVLKK